MLYSFIQSSHDKVVEKNLKHEIMFTTNKKLNYKGCVKSIAHLNVC